VRTLHINSENISEQLEEIKLSLIEKIYNKLKNSPSHRYDYVLNVDNCHTYNEAALPRAERLGLIVLENREDEFPSITYTHSCTGNTDDVYCLMLIIKDERVYIDICHKYDALSNPDEHLSVLLDGFNVETINYLLSTIE